MLNEKTIRLGIDCASHAIPYSLLRKLTVEKDSLILERILNTKCIRNINKNRIFNNIDQTTNYIEFKNDFNEFSVFNMCYLNDMLGKALFAVAIGVTPKFDVLDKDGENYFNIFFEPIDYMGKQNVNFYVPRIDGNTGGPHWFPSSEELIAYSKIFYKYFVIKKGILDRFNYELKRVRDIVQGGGMLYGCVIRGTDYIIKKPKGHPIQPETDIILQELKSVVNPNDYIYLATDEEKTVNLFKNNFPHHIICSPSQYYDGIYSNHNINIAEYTFNRDNDKFLRGFEYFERIYILSKCDAYIGGMSGACRMARIMNGGKYKFEKIFDLGLY